MSPRYEQAEAGFLKALSRPELERGLEWFLPTRIPVSVRWNAYTWRTRKSRPLWIYVIPWLVVEPNNRYTVWTSPPGHTTIFNYWGFRSADGGNTTSFQLQVDNRSVNPYDQEFQFTIGPDGYTSDQNNTLQRLKPAHIIVREFQSLILAWKGVFVAAVGDLCFMGWVVPDSELAKGEGIK